MAKNDFPWIDPYYHTIKPSNAAMPKCKYSKDTVKDVTNSGKPGGGVDSRPLKNFKVCPYDKQK